MKKIKCDCGEYLEDKKTTIDEIETKALVCAKCGYTTLNKEQVKDFVKLKQMHRLLDKERKVIRIGNSEGITVPFRELGVKIGEKVKLKALNLHSFKVLIK